MDKLRQLLENNRAWAADRVKRDPTFFTRLEKQQAPEFLWIGCSDSRVPANEIVDLDPGRAVRAPQRRQRRRAHRSNCLSVLQFAVDVLKVKHVIVCGHYGCGGVRAAMERESHGLIDNWLRHVQDVQRDHQKELRAIAGRCERASIGCAS